MEQKPKSIVSGAERYQGKIKTFGATIGNVSLRYSKIIRSSTKKSNFSRSWMCKIQIFQCYFDNNNTKQMVIKNSQKIIKAAKKHTKKMPLAVFPNLKQLINHRTASKKNQRKIIINICQLYSIPSHIRKKIESKKSARSNYV